MMDKKEKKTRPQLLSDLVGVNHAGEGALVSLKGTSPDLIAVDSVGNVDLGVDNLCGVEDFEGTTVSPGVVLVGFKYGVDNWKGIVERDGCGWEVASWVDNM